jgi:hypothetical protein
LQLDRPIENLKGDLKVPEPRLHPTMETFSIFEFLGRSFFIDSAQSSQYALQQWEKFAVPDTHEVSPFSKSTYHVFVQIEDESIIAESSAALAGKHFTNSTLIQMDSD